MSRQDHLDLQALKKRVAELEEQVQKLQPRRGRPPKDSTPNG